MKETMLDAFRTPCRLNTAPPACPVPWRTALLSQIAPFFVGLEDLFMVYVEVEHVTKKFGDDVILDDIDLSLEQGRVYGICGNNGSGKTVLMKCICGFLPVTSGRIRVAGKTVGVEVDFPESIGVIIETPGFQIGRAHV